MGDSEAAVGLDGLKDLEGESGGGVGGGGGGHTNRKKYSQVVLHVCIKTLPNTGPSLAS